MVLIRQPDPKVYINVHALKVREKRYKKKRFKKAVKEFFTGINPKDYEPYKMSPKLKKKSDQQFIRYYKKRNYIKTPKKIRNYSDYNFDLWDYHNSSSRKSWDYNNGYL